MSEENKYRVVFAPGCFDQFEGTQTELDELVAHITQLAESGELLANGEDLDLDVLMEKDPDLAQLLINQIEDVEQTNPRKLQ